MVRMRSPVQIWLSAPRRTTSIPDVVFFALYTKRLLRNLCVGCPLRTPKKCKRFFGLACCHLHSTHRKGRFYFVLYAKRLLRNLCVGCHLRTPRERPTAFRRLCLPSSPRANLGRRFFCVIRKTVATQPLRGLSSAHAEKMQALFRLSFRSLSGRFLTCVRNDKSEGSVRDCPRPTKRSRFA